MYLLHSKIHSEYSSVYHLFIIQFRNFVKNNSVGIKKNGVQKYISTRNKTIKNLYGLNIFSVADNFKDF